MLGQGAAVAQQDKVDVNDTSIGIVMFVGAIIAVASFCIAACALWFGLVARVETLERERAEEREAIAKIKRKINNGQPEWDQQS